MPSFDGTGPMGQGAMTGGGRGYCAVVVNSIDAKSVSGCGFYGRGGGRGHRNCFNATGFRGWIMTKRGFGGAISREEELALLKNQAGYLKDELDAIAARVQDIEGK